MSVELIIATFETDETKAGQAYQRLQELAEQGSVVVDHAAVVVKPQEGAVQVTDLGDVDPKRGRVFGAVTGAVVGLLGGPVGAIAGAIAGAVTGGAAAGLIDYGVPGKMIKVVQKGLQPGSSALIAYVELTWVEKAITLLEEAGATVAHSTMETHDVDDLV